MTTLQAVWLGAMLAWTPSIVLLAWLLREAPLDELDELQHDVS
jgi:HAMP domain-containing protein